MTEMQKAMVFAHRVNIDKYHRLLKTKLSEIEREFIERRLDEEEQELLEIAQRNALIDRPVPHVE